MNYDDNIWQHKIGVEFNINIKLILENIYSSDSTPVTTACPILYVLPLTVHPM